MSFNYAVTVPNLKVCRICLTQEGKFYDFFENNLTDIYLSFSGLLVTVNDGLPKFMCGLCRFLLFKSYNFKMKCHQATQFLRRTLYRDKILTAANFETPRAKKFNHELVITDAICYYSPPSDENTIYFEEVEETAEESIKTESLEIVEEPLIAESFKVELGNETINEVGTYSDKAVDPISSNSVPVQTERVVKLDFESILRKCLEINKAGKNECSDDDFLEDDRCTVEGNTALGGKADESTKQGYFGLTKDNETQCDDGDDVCLIDDENVAEVVISSDDENEKNKKKQKKSVKIAKSKEKPVSKKEFLKKYEKIKYFNKKKEFYEHIYKKYVSKGSTDASNNFNRKLDSLFDVKNNSDDSDSDSSQENLQIDKGNLNRNRNKLYDYIAKKYNKTKNKYKRTEKEINKFGKIYNMDVFVMNGEQQIADLEMNKQRSNYVNANYKCELCCRGFSAEQVYQNHMVIHDPSSGKYDCEICHTRFRIKRYLTRHMSERHKYKFQCKSCKQVVRNSSLAKEHFKCHQGFKYNCEQCGKMFSKYGSRMNHLRIFHGNVACNVCGLRFTPKGLSVHKTKAHREMYKCTKCGVQFHNSGALALHRESLGDKECGDNIKPCTICGDNFPDDDYLRHHNEQYHNERRNRIRDRKSKLTLKLEAKPNVKWRMKRKKVNNDGGDTATGVSEIQDVDGLIRKRGKQDKAKLVCEICGAEGFTSPCTLRYHQRIHTGEKPHRCTLCDKSFRLGIQLQAVKCPSCNLLFDNASVLSRHNENSIDGVCEPNIRACMRCGEGFPNEELYENHVREHHKKRRVSCEACDKTFSAEHNLSLHWSKSHSGVPRTRAKPRANRGEAPRDHNKQVLYMCDQCGKSFNIRTHFTLHMRLHTGEKPHQCPMCPKTFRLPLALKMHTLTHTDERPYRCAACPRAFRQSAHLHTHMRTHTLEKPHVCPVCHKAFSQVANMREHARTVHEGLPPRRRRRQATQVAT